MTAARLTPGAVARVTLPSPSGEGADVDLEVSALVIESEDLTITVERFYSGGASLTAPWPVALIAVLGADGTPVLMWVSAERIEGHEASEGEHEPEGALPAASPPAAALPSPIAPIAGVAPGAIDPSGFVSGHPREADVPRLSDPGAASRMPQDGRELRTPEGSGSTGEACEASAEGLRDVLSHEGEETPRPNSFWKAGDPMERLARMGDETHPQKFRETGR